MAADPVELVRRVEELEQRVRALEGDRASAAPDASLPAVLLNVHNERPKPAEIAPGAVRLDLRPTTQPVPAVVASLDAPPPPVRRDPDIGNASGAWAFERFVGGRFYAAIGSIVVVVGVGLFLRLAVQRGWLSFPPAARCLAAALFGGCLLGAGELARRKVSALASVGLSAAGIAVVYASVLAAYGWYRLFDPVPALLMLAAVSGVGVVVALRANQLVLAMLVSLAAHLTPLVLWKADMAPIVLPVYLLAVLGFGLWLAGARANPFAPVRFAVMLGTGLIGSLWAQRSAESHAPLVLGFMALVWAAVHAELIRSVILSGDPSAAPPSAPTNSPSPLFARSVFASLGVTLWATVGGVAAARESRAGFNPAYDWTIPALLGLGAAVLGACLGRGLWTLVRTPRDDRDRVSLLLLAQAGGLLVTAMALGIDASLQSSCWLALGTAAAIGGAIAGSQAIVGYGLLLLAIAVGRLLAWDSWHLPSRGVEIAGIVATRWSVLMLAAGACLAASGGVIRRRSGTEGWRQAASGCLAVAVLLPMLSTMTSGSRGDSVSIWCAMLCAVAWGIASLWRSTGLGVFAGLITAVGLGLTTIGQAVLAEEDAFIEFFGLVVTRWSLGAVCFGGAIALGAAAAGRVWVRGSRAATGVCSAGATAALMLAPNLAHCSGGAVTLWWVIVGVFVAGVRALRPQLPALGDISRCVLVLATTVWFTAYPLADWNASGSAVLLHPGLWIAIVLCVVIALLHLWLRHTEQRSVPPAVAAFEAIVAWVSVGLLSFTASSFEVARTARLLIPGDPTAQNGVVSLWWGFFAGCLLAIGFARKMPAARHVGLGLLGVATAKAVLFDLREVSPEWRIASFLGLGLLMLGVAVVYARVSRRIDGTPATGG